MTLPSLLISVPVLGRPHRAAPLVESALAATPRAHVLFSCSPGDDDEIAACRAAGADVAVVEWEPGRGDWARKQQAAFDAAEEEWILLAADDVLFEPGWFEACLRVHEETGVCVVGTNDESNPRVKAGEHATHPLVNEGYRLCGSADDPERILHVGYFHNFVDTEFVETAIARGTFAAAPTAVVRHFHPAWRTAPNDETYRLGQRHFARDRRLFLSRRHLWSGGRRLPRVVS